MAEKIKQWVVKPEIGGGCLAHGIGIGIRFTGEDGTQLDVMMPYEGLNKLMLGFHRLSHEAYSVRAKAGITEKGFSAYSDPLLAIETVQLSTSESDSSRMMLQLQSNSGMVWSLFLAPMQAQSLYEELGKILNQ